MIDVICFCGSSYSFTGDAGACPQCGELATFPRARTAAEPETHNRVDSLRMGSADESHPDELAA